MKRQIKLILILFLIIISFSFSFAYGDSCVPSVTDSDGGIKIFVKGGAGMITSDCNQYTFNDECLDDNTKVKEWFVVGGSLCYTILNCPDGYLCDNGKCLPFCSLESISIDGLFVNGSNITGYIRVKDSYLNGCDKVDILQIDVDDVGTNGSVCHVEFNASNSTGGVSGITLNISGFSDHPFYIINENHFIYRFSFNTSLLPKECIGRYLRISAAGLWHGLPGQGRGYSFLFWNKPKWYPPISQGARICSDVR